MTENHNYLTSVGMDHVRLSYCYLDDGDVDAYCSLFTEQAVHRAPGAVPVTCRRALEHAERSRQSGVRHSIDEVIGSGERIVAIGRRHPHTTAGDADLPFVDIFTVADNGLLIDRTTFLFSPCRPAI